MKKENKTNEDIVFFILLTKYWKCVT